MYSRYSFTSHRCHAEHKCGQALQASRNEFSPTTLLLPGDAARLYRSQSLDRLTIDAPAGYRDRSVCPYWTVLSDNAEARKLAGPSFRHVRSTQHRQRFLDIPLHTNARFLDAHIRSGYTFIMQNYRPGDRISLFGWSHVSERASRTKADRITGFSRGAYVARALAGMLHKVCRKLCDLV